MINSDYLWGMDRTDALLEEAAEGRDQQRLQAVWYGLTDALLVSGQNGGP
jgi:hypothetical protein